MVSDKRVSILWLENCQGALSYLLMSYSCNKKGKKMSSFFSTSIKNIMSKGAAEVSHHEPILDGETQQRKQQTC